MNLPETLEILIITLSDRASAGEYEDRSGPAIREKLREFFSASEWSYNITARIIPDNAKTLRELLTGDSGKYNIIFTTGGTGVGPKDITTATVKPLLRK